MRYRALSAAGDYTFGQGSVNFLIDTPQAVGQAVQTRLLLFVGEWFLDNTEGTPYATQIFGAHTQNTRDRAIRDRILGTQGVTGIESYSSVVTPDRKFTVTATINTQFGQTQVVVTL